MFALHADFADKTHVCDLSLCAVLVDEFAQFPWVILVPRVDSAKNILSLNSSDGLIFWHEINLVARAVTEILVPDQINMATLGNVTPQLHAHVIARFAWDAAWPGSPFGHKKLEDKSQKTQFLSRHLVQKISTILPSK